MSNIEWTDSPLDLDVSHNKHLFQYREKNSNWRGGRSLASNGYILLRVGIKHPLADVRGYAYEHRVVAEKKIGRALKPNEHVHHIDGDKTNNVPENLEVLLSVEHHFRHRIKESNLKHPFEKNTTVRCKCGCGEAFLKFDTAGRPREFISGHNSTLEKKSRQELIVDYVREKWVGVADISSNLGISMQATRSAANNELKNGILIKFKNKFFHKDFPPEQYINPFISCACGCKNFFRKYDSSMRERRYISGHNIFKH